MSLLAKLKQQWNGDLDNVRDAIIDNLSALLSARVPVWQNTELGPLGKQAISSFGMTNLQLSQGGHSADIILHDVRNLILCFEPRLKEVVVELDKSADVSNKLNFRIEGIISSQFGEELVSFDSSLDFTSSSLDVRKTNLV
jgi:type VI secretion system protein ImpF